MAGFSDGYGVPAMQDPAPRIILRPVGSPLTIGMSGLAMASLLESGLDLRLIAASQVHQIGVILLIVPFVLQLVACVFSYLARDGATGATVGVLSTSWAAVGAVHLMSSPGSRSGALGLLLLGAGGVLVLSALVVASAKPLPGFVFLAAGARFILSGLFQLTGSAVWREIGGILGLVIVGLACYCVLAFELEGQMGAPVLPTFRRGRGALALDGDLDAQLTGIAHEPGVRQTT